MNNFFLPYKSASLPSTSSRHPWKRCKQVSPFSATHQRRTELNEYAETSHCSLLSSKSKSFPIEGRAMVTPLFVAT